MPPPYGGDPDTLADIGRCRLFGAPRRKWERYVAVVAALLLIALAAFLLWPSL